MTPRVDDPSGLGHAATPSLRESWAFSTLRLLASSLFPGQATAPQKHRTRRIVIELKGGRHESADRCNPRTSHDRARVLRVRAARDVEGRRATSLAGVRA